tara:strand:+ start:122 stop:421 length:300 start_codon:yes stop_codon:yes gene_type:complete
MGFDIQTLDVTDIERAQKQGIRAEEHYQRNIQVDPKNPLKGTVSKQRANARKAADVLDIGAGTRCKHCGMLHFMWRETCGVCDKPMEYNLGTRNEEARM